jgi:hypothetical protein
MTTWNDPKNDQVVEYDELLAQPDGKPPRQCATRISAPRPGVSVLQRLHSPIKEPEPPEAA